jgi:hypothetical protein
MAAQKLKADNKSDDGLETENGEQDLDRTNIGFNAADKSGAHMLNPNDLMKQKDSDEMSQGSHLPFRTNQDASPAMKGSAKWLVTAWMYCLGWLQH